MERFVTTPFDDMEKIDEGLYGLVISGFRGEAVNVEEGKKEVLIFGRMDETVPVITCLDGESSLASCTEMILIHFGIENTSGNAFRDDAGITLYDAVREFEVNNLEVEWFEGDTMELLAEQLDEGGSVLCMVSGIVLNVPEMSDFPGLTADHPVVVTTIDVTNPANPQITFHDPRSNTGKKSCDLSLFLSAWEKGNSRMVVIREEV